MLGRKATRAAIYRALRRLADSAEPGDSVLIYYAGHGDLDRQYNDGWWIPVDAQAQNPVTYLDNVQVQKAMRNMKARHVLLISDSCYSGTLFGQRPNPAAGDHRQVLPLSLQREKPMGHDLRQQDPGFRRRRPGPQYFCLPVAERACKKRAALSQHPGTLYPHCAHCRQQFEADPPVQSHPEHGGPGRRVYIRGFQRGRQCSVLPLPVKRPFR